MKTKRNRSSIEVFARAKLPLSRTRQPCLGSAGASPSQGARHLLSAVWSVTLLVLAIGCSVETAQGTAQRDSGATVAAEGSAPATQNVSRTEPRVVVVIDHSQPPAVAKKPPRYTFDKLHDPRGIGKFYMGREIAHVMGFGGAPWLERNEREREERISLMVKVLKLKAGDVVADIGAGSGVISELLAKQIAPDGKVLAVDVQQKMLDRLQKRMKDRGVTNVVPVKGTQKSPNLKPGSVDLVILVDVYHEFEFPYEMTQELAKSLKPGGRIAWVEYRKEDPTVPIYLVHKMTEAQVKVEAGQKEFRLKYKETIGILPRQHIVIFERPKKK